MLIKKRLYLTCFKVESRSANLTDHKLHIFCQDNVCDTQPLLAAFLSPGLQELFWLPSFSGVIKILSQHRGVPAGTAHAVTAIRLNYLTTLLNYLTTRQNFIHIH